ncbi:hypothetical protein TNCV_3186431 [Trichonephila clavipes]|nr:hypothetical protein TNCV_3186431 [Trichonephila clavipes]
MGTPTARNVVPSGSEYAETVRSNHCILAIMFPYGRDGEPLARVPLMAHGKIFWAHHRSKRSTAIDSSIKEFSVHTVRAQVPPSGDGNWASKLLAVLGCRLYPGEDTRSAKVKIPMRSPIRKENYVP